MLIQITAAILLWQLWIFSGSMVLMQRAAMHTRGRLVELLMKFGNTTKRREKLRLR